MNEKESLRYGFVPVSDFFALWENAYLHEWKESHATALGAKVRFEDSLFRDFSRKGFSLPIQPPDAQIQVGGKGQPKQIRDIYVGGTL